MQIKQKAEKEYFQQDFDVHLYFHEDCVTIPTSTFRFKFNRKDYHQFLQPTKFKLEI